MREYSLDEVKETITLEEDKSNPQTITWDEFYNIYERLFRNGYELYTDEGELLNSDDAVEWIWNHLPKEIKEEPF